MKLTEDPIPTRESLLGRLRDWSDETSWREFFDTYWRLIYNFAVKAGLNDAEAQDVVQNTLLSVAKIMPGFKYNPAIGSFKGFLLQTVRWRIADHFRQERRVLANQGIAVEDESGSDIFARIPDPTGLNFESNWDQEWEKNLLSAALDRIKHRVNPKHYQLFDLFVNREWTVAEITETLGVTQHQIYASKSRLSKLLRQEIEKLRRSQGL